MGYNLSFESIFPSSAMTEQKIKPRSQISDANALIKSFDRLFARKRNFDHLEAG